MLKINVIGAGILGLWQAYRFAKAGHQVHLLEKSETLFETASSRLAGAMLAPFCESEASQRDLIPHALRSLALWSKGPCDFESKGTLIIAPPRDRVELTSFAKRTIEHQHIKSETIAKLEPALEGRFNEALYFEKEGHLAPRPTLKALIAAFREFGGEVTLGFTGTPPKADYTIDTRGMGAKSELKAKDRALRPVRGEMVVVHAPGLKLYRPIRLLHPRMPSYIVPWPDDHYMIGATVIESDDEGPITLRSGLELLGSAFTVHPAFGDAKIIEFNAGSRPSFFDNLPKIVLDETHIFVNGAYRHGFLLAPLLAELVLAHIENGEPIEGLFQ
ncbi:MAG: FAD-dependent oxidoreductase [Hyphomicrobiales bacterium]